MLKELYVGESKIICTLVHVLQLAILLVGHDKIHMVYSSPTIVVQV
jgi:hypothetical protein